MLRAILRRANIEPVLLLLITNLVLSGVTLLFASEAPGLPAAKAVGVFYILLALIGAHGLFGRDSRVRAAFGFLGLFVRLWLAARFLLADWQDPQWCGYLLGAMCYAWIAARSACRHVWVETRVFSSQ